MVGYDFHFGAKRSGTPEFLRTRGAELGLTIEIVEKVTADEEGSIEAVSSTATREALTSGDVAAASALLGHPWSVTGEVIHGAKLGRTLGYPTANLALDETCGLRHAIYAVEVELDGDSGSRASPASAAARPWTTARRCWKSIFSIFAAISTARTSKSFSSPSCARKRSSLARSHAGANPAR